MKNKKYWILAGVLTTCLAAVCIANFKTNVQQMLRGIDGVRVEVQLLPEDTSKGVLLKSQIQTDVELKLRHYGIKVLSQAEDGPVLSVYVITYTIQPDPEQYAFGYASSVNVTLKELAQVIRSGEMFQASTWQISSVIYSPKKDVFSSDVRSNISDQMDVFINDYLAVNPKEQPDACAQVTVAPQSTTLPALKQPDFSGLTTYPVVRVIDGDTIVVGDDGKEITVRLVGVDTPETVHPTKPVEHYGKEASRFTSNLLKGKKVYLVSDPQQSKTDRYGRTLAYVYRAPDGLFINAEIIRQGYGHAYPRFPFKFIEEFRQLEQFARKAEKGLWAPLPSLVKPKGEAQSDVADITVYVTRTGKKYHTGSCSYLRKSKILIKLKDAKEAGYTPCSRCSPPR